MNSIIQKAVIGAAAFALVGAGIAAGAQINNTPKDANAAKVESVALAAQPVAAVFPQPNSTGIPPGTVLTLYTGPLTIRSCGVVIDSMDVVGDLDVLASNGTHSASTPCVTVKNSLVKGIIDDKWSSYSCAGKTGCGPVVVINSEIANPNARDVACISDANFYMTGSKVGGCRSGAQADGNIVLRGNYLLADTEFGTAHMDAFITNGNYGAPIVLDGNSFLCAPTGSVPNGSGCAADVGLFGDFSAVTNMTVTNNIFRGTSDAYFCLHSPYEPGKPYPNGGNDVIRDNVFERGPSGKCGGAGPVFNWNNSAGEWCRNLYADNGAPVLPSNPDNCTTAPPTTTTTVTATTIPTTVSSVPPPSTTTTKATTTTVAPTTTRPSTTTVPVTSTTVTTPTTGPCFRTAHNDKVCQVP